MSCILNQKDNRKAWCFCCHCCIADFVGQERDHSSNESARWSWNGWRLYYCGWTVLGLVVLQHCQTISAHGYAQKNPSMCCYLQWLSFLKDSLCKYCGDLKLWCTWWQREGNPISIFSGPHPYTTAGGGHCHHLFGNYSVNLHQHLDLSLV